MLAFAVTAVVFVVALVALHLADVAWRRVRLLARENRRLRGGLAALSMSAQVVQLFCAFNSDRANEANLS